MLGAHVDLPLSKDPAVRILPWIVGLMVYLATMTLAGALLVSGLASDWSAGLTVLSQFISLAWMKTMKRRWITRSNVPHGWR